MVLLREEHEGVEKRPSEDAAEDDAADHGVEVFCTTDRLDVDAPDVICCSCVVVETVSEHGEFFGL